MIIYIKLYTQHFNNLYIREENMAFDTKTFDPDLTVCGNCLFFINRRDGYGRCSNKTNDYRPYKSENYFWYSLCISFTFKILRGFK